jgi:hypothetical protein
MMLTHNLSAGTVLGRAAWSVAAVALLGGAVFEAAKHGGSTIAWAALGVLAPGVSLIAEAKQRRARGESGPRTIALYNLLHRPWLPLGVMIGSAFTGQPAAAGLFALGCAWLGHLAIERACGRRVAAYQHRSVLPPAERLSSGGMPTGSVKP